MAKRYELTESAMQRVAAAVRGFEALPEVHPQRHFGTATPIPYEFRRFILKEALAAGGSAEAYPLVRRSDDSLSADSTRTIKVYDVTGQISGSIGAKAWAIKPHDGDRWEIVGVAAGARVPIQLEEYAPWLHSVSGTDNQFTVDDFIGWRWREAEWVGNAPGSGVTNLRTSCTSFGDPCLRLDVEGLWLLDWTAQYADANQDWSEHYETDNTSEASGHYHTYDKFIPDKWWTCARSIAEGKVPGGSWSEIDALRLDCMIPKGNWASGHVTVGATGLISVPALTELRFTSKIDPDWGYGGGHGSASIDAGYLMLERIGGRTDVYPSLPWFT